MPSIAITRRNRPSSLSLVRRTRCAPSKTRPLPILVKWGPRSPSIVRSLAYYQRCRRKIWTCRSRPVANVAGRRGCQLVRRRCRKARCRSIIKTRRKIKKARLMCLTFGRIVRTRWCRRRMVPRRNAYAVRKWSSRAMLMLLNRWTTRR